MKKDPRNLEELLLNDSFIRWIRGFSNEQEDAFWKNWKNQDPEHLKLIKEAKEVLQTMQFQRVDTTDMEQELNKLNASLDAEIPVINEEHRTRHKRSTIYRYVSAAAVVLIIATAGFFVLNQPFNFSSKQTAALPVQTKIIEKVVRASNTEPANAQSPETNTLSTGYAEQSTVIFDDGSRVVLNAKSTLEYPTKNTKYGDITVRLKGEAYFDIAEKKPANKRTFSVQTENGSVNVLGTKFSVQTGDAQTQVALKEGVVQVHTTGARNSEDLEYTMKPGEITQFGLQNSTIEVDEINTDVYFSWTQNELLFDDTPLSEIVQRVEQTYGVNVIVEDQSLLDKEISGSIQNNDLDVLLKALSELLQTPINRDKNTITIDT